MNPVRQNPFSAAEPSRATVLLWCLPLVLVIIVITAFSSSVEFDFINYDDPLYITENPNVNSGLTLANLKWALFSSGEANLWGPLTYASHQLDVSLFGLNPARHHAVNVLWHALATVFLFLTALKLTKSSLWSFFIALIWAIHPEKIQSVAWLSERKDVLSGALFFASLYFFTCWNLRPVKNPALYSASFLLFILSLMSKPSVVPLPLVLFLLFYLDPKRIVASVCGAIRPLVPFVAAAILVAGIALYFKDQGDLGNTAEKLTIALKASHVVISYVFYLNRFFWPAPAQLWFLPSDPIFSFVSSVAILAVFAPLVLWLGSKEKLIITGAAIYTILWLPISGLVSVSSFFVADRYSYLPQIGLIFMTVGLVKLLSRFSTSLFSATLALGSFSVVILTLQQKQLPLWKDSETLFAHEMAVSPQSLLAPIHYGEVFKESDPEKALLYYARAHRNDPQAGIALAKMGMIQKQLGRRKEALESFLKGTQVATQVRENWTLLLLQQVELRLYEQAEETIKRGIEYDPQNWDFIMNSGNFYLMIRKRANEALPYFLEAHSLEPSDPRSIQACADCHRALGNTNEARKFENLLRQEK